MPVSDALDDGYELVVVSADLEEAWSVQDPAVRQIVYYDDFLGRSALEPRLGRNEDDSLVAFIRLAGRSATTRFVLTTREYILRHAHQLYERLADGDLGPENPARATGLHPAPARRDLPQPGSGLGRIEQRGDSGPGRPRRVRADHRPPKVQPAADRVDHRDVWAHPYGHREPGLRDLRGGGS